MKQTTSKNRKKRIFFISTAAAIGLLLTGGFFSLSRPKILWYVDADLSAAWNRILSQGNTPLSHYEVLPLTGEGFPRGRYGFTVSRRGPEGKDAGTVRVYPNLARNREYSGWLAIALDPWMIFRRHDGTPEPLRTYIDSPRVPRSPEGLLLLPGNEDAAVDAWLFQILQKSPGVFTWEEEVWDRTRSFFTQSHNFQEGSAAYTWVQTWPLLFRQGAAWIYAPISQTRSLDAYHMGLLDAVRFPEPENWNQYGLQAEVLWSCPQGSEKQLKKLQPLEDWLRDPHTQELIANTIEWIPAHPNSLPYNTIFSQTQIAWIRSSFIWSPAE